MSVLQATVAQLSPELVELLPTCERDLDPFPDQNPANPQLTRAAILEARIREVFPAIEVISEASGLRVLGLWDELRVIQRALDSWALAKIHNNPDLDFQALDFSQQELKEQCSQTDKSDSFEPISVDMGVQTDSLANKPDTNYSPNIMKQENETTVPNLSSIEIQTEVDLENYPGADAIESIMFGPESDSEKEMKKTRGRKKKATKSYKSRKSLPNTDVPHVTRRKGRPRKSIPDVEANFALDENVEKDIEGMATEVDSAYDTMLSAMFKASEFEVCQQTEPEAQTDSLVKVKTEQIAEESDDESVSQGAEMDLSASEVKHMPDEEEIDPPLFADMEPIKIEKSAITNTEGHYDVLTKEENASSGEDEVSENNDADVPKESRKIIAYKCKHCQHVACDRRSLRDHLRRNHFEKPHVCSVCGKAFGLNKDLTRHMFVHKTRLYCSVSGCTFKTKTKKQLDRHTHAMHEQKLRRGRPKVEIRSEDRPVSCPVADCDYTTNRKKNLADHMKRGHGDKVHECPICKKMYAVKKDLNQHIRFHTQRFCCEICGKELKSKFALNLHVNNIHKNMNIRLYKKYLCTTCGKLCRSKTEYKIHMNKEHLKIKPFKCSECDMAFFARANLKTHMSVHSDAREFTCDVCGKAFKQRQGLKIHKKIHDVDRPYKCSTCEKTFTQRGALTRHERIHTGEKPYACKLCSSSFNDYSILRRHVLGIHKIDDHILVRRTATDESVAKCLATKVDGKRSDKLYRGRRSTIKPSSDIQDLSKAEYPKGLVHQLSGQHPQIQVQTDSSQKVNIILAAAQQSFLGERDSEVQAAQALSHLQQPQSQEQGIAGNIITLPDGRQGTILQQLQPLSAQQQHQDNTTATYVQIAPRQINVAPGPFQEAPTYMFQSLN